MKAVFGALVLAAGVAFGAVPTIPTMSGGTLNRIPIAHVDLGVGTKDKAEPFYG